VGAPRGDSLHHWGRGGRGAKSSGRRQYLAEEPGSYSFRGEGGGLKCHTHQKEREKPETGEGLTKSIYGGQKGFFIVGGGVKFPAGWTHVAGGGGGHGVRKKRHPGVKRMYHLQECNRELVSQRAGWGGGKYNSPSWKKGKGHTSPSVRMRGITRKKKRVCGQMGGSAVRGGQ